MCQKSSNHACARGVVDALVVREHHRDQAGVARALHVVLAAQRMQPGAGLADLPGHRGQRDQAARVVGAVDVLADAHAPQDHRALARSRRRARPRAASRPGCRRSAPSPPGCSPSRSRAAPRSCSTRSRMKSSSARPSSITVWISALSIATSVSALNCSVRQAWRAEVGAARIGEHDLRAALGGVLHPGRGDRMVRGRVGADHEDQVRHARRR